MAVAMRMIMTVLMTVMMTVIMTVIDLCAGAMRVVRCHNAI